MLSIGVLGAGSWGSALALHLSRAGNKVCIWARNENIVTEINEKSTNSKYLPSEDFTNIFASNDLRIICDKSDILLIATPSSTLESLVENLDKFLSKDFGLIIASKGLAKSGELLSNIFVKKGYSKLAFLQGPSFAKEVASGKPCAVMLASEDVEFMNLIKSCFDTNFFRVKICKDIVGVQLAGVLKNILAIGVGILDGLGQGANIRALFITIAYKELIELGNHFKVDLKTINDLAGFSDLILTTTDNQSRNRRFGLYFGQGMNHLEAQNKLGQVVEGFDNFICVKKFIDANNLSLPITCMVMALVEGKIDSNIFIKEIMNKFN